MIKVNTKMSVKQIHLPILVIEVVLCSCLLLFSVSGDWILEKKLYLFTKVRKILNKSFLYSWVGLSDWVV